MQTYQGVSISGKNTCQVDAELTKGLDDAILRIDESQCDQSLSQKQAGESLAIAQAAWIEHKMSCVLCCGQLTGASHSFMNLTSQSERDAAKGFSPAF
jgi:uncharacterized protein YecT (DUF1311 family)